MIGFTSGNKWKKGNFAKRTHSRKTKLFGHPIWRNDLLKIIPEGKVLGKIITRKHLFSRSLCRTLVAQITKH